MTLGVWGEFFLKMFVLLAGVFAITLITPRLASFIDKRRGKGEDPEEPRPERVENEDIDNKDNNGKENVAESNDIKYKKE